MAESYLPPVSNLLTLGEPEPVSADEWPRFSEMGFTADHVSDLVRLMSDASLHALEEDASERWAPVHAWRALGQLRAERAADPMLDVLIGRGDDDWIGIEVPMALGMIGHAVLGPVSERLPDLAKQEQWTNAIAVAGVLPDLVERFPELRDDAVRLLTSQLSLHLEQHPELNGFLVTYLMDLGAAEAESVVEEAYEAGSVDEMICGDWEDAQVGLGLIPERITPRVNLLHRALGGQFRQPMPQPAGRGKTSKSRRKAEKASRKKNRRKK